MISRRRVVLALGASTFAASGVSFAQQASTKVPRIGFLGSESATVFATRVEALRAGLRDFGYVEGKNIVIDFQWAEGKRERLPELAAELVRLKADVIVTHAVPATRAAKQATTTIPIVMTAVGDAVANGIVTSLARPDSNITGTTYFVPELNAKRLELLKEILPQITQVAILLNPNNPSTGVASKAAGQAAKLLKLSLHEFPVRAPNEFDSTVAAIAKKRVGAVVIYDDPMLIGDPKPIADLTAKHRLPSAGVKQFAEAGGMIGYGVDNLVMFRRTGYFVDKILKGTKPGDLPIEQPTNFELVVNLNAAKALGVKIPNSIRVRATSVIE